MTAWQRFYSFFWMRTHKIRRWWFDTLPMFIAWHVLPPRLVLWCFIQVYSVLKEAPTEEYRRAYLKFVQDNNIEGM